MRLIILVGLFSLGAFTAKAELIERDLDIERYMGKWYEVARLPLSFETKCHQPITAQYELREDKKVNVINSCVKNNDKLDKATGLLIKAKKNSPEAKFKVTFVPSLRHLPFVWAPYWVLKVTPDYNYALVGSKNKKFLWILSRQDKNYDYKIINEFINLALKEGYNMDNAIYSPYLVEEQ